MAVLVSGLKRNIDLLPAMFNLTNDSLFIILNAFFVQIDETKGRDPVVKGISKEVAERIAVDFMKRRKNTEKVDISIIEQSNAAWIIRGTCPIDMEGHPWAEKFEVVVDMKGKIKSSSASLL